MSADPSTLPCGVLSVGRCIVDEEVAAPQLAKSMEKMFQKRIDGVGPLWAKRSKDDEAMCARQRRGVPSTGHLARGHRTVRARCCEVLDLTEPKSSFV